MSFGDTNKYSIPSTYKGIKMRSKLETKVALFLDYLNIKWEYEPRMFLLSSGIYYKPDFYLPELNQWIEVKGIIGENNIEISKKFIEDNKAELILISSRAIIFFENFDTEGKINAEWYDGLQIGLCSKCKKHFFTSQIGSYHCRNCLNHEGDHDIFAFINGDSNEHEVDFSDINSIKGWLGDNGTRI